jgi:hypothetical protein
MASRAIPDKDREVQVARKIKPIRRVLFRARYSIAPPLPSMHCYTVAKIRASRRHTQRIPGKENPTSNPETDYGYSSFRGLPKALGRRVRRRPRMPRYHDSGYLTHLLTLTERFFPDKAKSRAVVANALYNAKQGQTRLARRRARLHQSRFAGRPHGACRGPRARKLAVRSPYPKSVCGGASVHASRGLRYCAASACGNHAR